MRPFALSDSKKLWEWQAIPGMRQYFRNPTVPSMKEHNNWCQRLIEESGNEAYVIESSKKPVGFVRLKQMSNLKTWEVSILLDPAFRGRGIARETLAIVKDQFGDRLLKAHIHSENKKSIALFQGAGFKPEAGKMNWYYWDGGI